MLPDAMTGQSYAGQLSASHDVGGTLGIVAGALPAGLSLPATFTGSGTAIGGTPAAPGIEPTSAFTVQGTDTQGQPLYQPYQITVDPNQALAVVLPGSGSTLFPGTVGQALALNFFLSGGAAPYTWAVVANQLPPGLHLQTFSTRATLTTSSPGRPPRPAPSPGRCGSPTSTAIRLASSSPSPSSPEPHLPHLELWALLRETPFLPEQPPLVNR